MLNRRNRGDIPRCRQWVNAGSFSRKLAARPASGAHAPESTARMVVAPNLWLEVRKSHRARQA